MGGIDAYPYSYPRVNTLATSGGALYAGGLCTTAGTNVSFSLAEAILGSAPVNLAISTDDASFGFSHGIFGFDLYGPSGSTVAIEASTDLHTWVPLQTNVLGSGPLYFSDPQSPTTPRRYYRAQLLP